MQTTAMKTMQPHVTHDHVSYHSYMRYYYKYKPAKSKSFTKEVFRISSEMWSVKDDGSLNLNPPLK